MVTRAIAKYVRVSPRKVRQVIDLIRGEDVDGALIVLSHLNKRAATYVERALKSALANAERGTRLKAQDLYISKITADGGPFLKRHKAAPMGRAVMIRRRTTHITVELDKK